ncbi:hypothetical protein L207DRAFT_472191 [Hyaloscypha variabilis F]|uniref:Clr5 domain-containing protein n=1 Tax=Hyaloscypha variabilis (strain UAMH 11265 / GT02V1 / F) TaxID=1149755 RepID=A0A2J6QZ51_HYAVF|nr:hypothetical protein L207DRAFT_472191 [Hyaloscypha variabilis F]
MSSYLQPNLAQPAPGPGHVAAASYDRAASRAEWNRFRPLIKRLYVDEEKTLKEVIAIMERDYGHRASIKMYKARIKKWNLDKKTKEAEAWALLRKKLQREAAGKESAFRVRGKTVTIDDVLRYFKRKGILDPETQTPAAGPPTPPAIECWTPVPSPNPEFASVLGIEEIGSNWFEFPGAEQIGIQSFAPGSPLGSSMLGFLNVNQTRQILFSDPEIQSFEIPSSPLPPQSFLVPEKLFACITTYFHGAFDSGFFETDDRGFLARTADEAIEDRDPVDFYDLCSSGVDLMDLGSYAVGRRFFSKASSLTQGLLRSQNPRTLENLFGSLILIRNNGYNQVATVLQTHMRDTASLLLADGHPWRQLFSQLANIEEWQFDFILIEAWRCICDTFTNSLGEFHRTALFSNIEFQRLKSPSRSDPQLLHNLLVRAEQELGEFDERIFDIQYHYGISLYNNNQYAEAREVLEEVIVHCEEREGLKFRVANSLDLIVDCGYLLGCYEENDEFRLQEAIGELEAVYGKFDVDLFTIKIHQERRLRLLGREAEAAQLHAEWIEGLGPDDIELESN